MAYILYRASKILESYEILQWFTRIDAGEMIPDRVENRAHSFRIRPDHLGQFCIFIQNPESLEISTLDGDRKFILGE